MKAQTQRRVRQIHLYLGVFFAPAILLFAISGSLQTFRLQEAGGWGGPPPQWIVWAASVHKDQTLPHPRPPRPDAPKKAGPPRAEVGPSRAEAGPSPFALKVFTGLLGIGLALSALLGIVVALTSRATRSMSVLMLVLGAALPLALLFRP